MKKILVPAVLAVAMAAALMLTSCNSVQISEPSTLDGITIAVQSLNLEKNKNTNSTIFDIKVTIENGSEADLSSVTYLVEYFDKNGKKLEEARFTYYAENEPLHPGGTATHEQGWQESLDADVARVDVSVDEYATDADEPTLTFPVVGEYLYQTIGEPHLANIQTEKPLKFLAWIDQGGARKVIETEDPALIDQFVNAFVKIKIAAETDEFVTDNYNGAAFIFADGETVGISLNLTNLEVTKKYQEHLYELEDFDEFWGLVNEYAEYPEGEEATSGGS
ncbi:MAG: hypothetical protein IKZ87_08905 [Actinomycetaceae bacterium]|nr:hypothetical protein [Actinomycetaceae bacterium]